MKHTYQVTFLLLSLFFLAQLIGLFVANYYLDRELPYGMERPQIEEEKPVQSTFLMMAAIIIASIIFIIFARFKLSFLWKIWFFLAVLLMLSITFASFLNHTIAFVLALTLAFFKVVKRNIVIHNITEIFMYGAVSAIFAPVLSVKIALMFLAAISVYDIISVFVTKHMVTMAKFQTKLGLFAGLLIPYKRNIAVLGGGDIGLPLLFSSVLIRDYGLYNAIIVSISATLALCILLYKAEKKKFYPAMPFITAGILLGIAVSYLVL